MQEIAESSSIALFSLVLPTMGVAKISHRRVFTENGTLGVETTLHRLLGTFCGFLFLKHHIEIT